MLLPFNPSIDPRVLRLLGYLVERPEALFLFVYRHIFRLPLGMVLQNIGGTPFDQLALQVESELSKHFAHAVSPLVVKYALYNLRHALGMDNHGVASPNGPGKRTLADSLPHPASVHITGLLSWAEERIQRAYSELPASHAAFEKFFEKNDGELHRVIRHEIGHPEEDLVDEIAQATWQTGMLLHDPKRAWTLKFLVKIAERLLKEEWRRRRRWGALAALEGKTPGIEDEEPGGPMAIDRVPAPDSGESPWLLPLELYETAVRELLRVPGPPLHRAMYLATALLGIKPETIVKHHRQMSLADFVHMLEIEYLGRSRLDQPTVTRLFEPLRNDLERKPGRIQRPGATRGAKRPRVRPPGRIRIEEHFTSLIFKRRTRAISDYAENAKRQLWKAAGRSGSVLFRALREEDPSWTGPRPQRQSQEPAQNPRRKGSPSRRP